MTTSPHMGVRRAAVICLRCIGLVAGILFIMVLVRGKSPMGLTIIAVVITTAIGAAPLGVVVWRLMRGPDAIGLAVAIAYPMLVFAVLIAEARAMWAGGTQQQMDLFARIVFFWADPAWAVFVAGFLPCLAWMAARSVRALRAGTSGSPGLAFIASSLVLVAGYAFIWRPITGYPSLDPKGLEHLNVRSLTSGGPPGSRRMVRSAGKAFDLTRDIYDCLLPPEGRHEEPLRFPPTLDGIVAADSFTSYHRCRDLVQGLARAPGPYRVTYVPGPLAAEGTAGGFTLRVRERNVGRWGLRSEEWEVGESAAARRTLFDWRGRVIEGESGAQFVDGLVTILFIERMIATPFGGDSSRSIPHRLSGELPADSVPGEGTLVLPGFSTCKGTPYELVPATGASCLTTTYRRWIYEPVPDATGRVTAWAMHAPAPTNWGTTPSDFGGYRSYYRDAAGAMHGRGAWSPAGPDDPLVSPEEMYAARHLLERWWTMKVTDWQRGLK